MDGARQDGSIYTGRSLYDGQTHELLALSGYVAVPEEHHGSRFGRTNLRDFAYSDDAYRKAEAFIDEHMKDN
jgi:hypothetical protein